MHLYLHIPFCRQACHYCDFHFSTSQQNRSAVTEAMMKELALRKNELPGTELKTIYFGGGTPSQLPVEALKFIFDEIAKHFSIAKDAEITLEGNPDDLSKKYLSELKSTPVNRLSIGVQSFRDVDLQLMNRAHLGQQAEKTIIDAQDLGFTNLTVDLIYGIPGQEMRSWKKNMEKVLLLGVPHFSAYCLTVEPRTALAHFVKTGKIAAVDEEQAAAFFLELVHFAATSGYQHYEISNFAREGFIAKHNSSYWFGEPYLGIGPSAHSFDGKTRRWNVANNAQYVKRISEGTPAWEEETLSENERFNELVMTRMRTMWGISEEEIRNAFGEKFAQRFVRSSEKWIVSGDMIFENGRYVLTPMGKLMSDRIVSDLFMV